ncbi:MAG: hypothetical protein KJZ87_23645 [Thermoguttaceae bacterium]|nr:hypothetical protein [Thermoguttaceae bacterium]
MIEAPRLLARPTALLAAFRVLLVANRNATTLEYPGTPPGKAVAQIQDGTIRLENNVLRIT